MSLEQKKAHMQKAIMPKAAKLFKEWRPKKYSHTDCRLCHGPVITNGNFNMPAENLPRLSGKVLLGPEFNNHPQTTRLKLDQLVPLMSKALGKKSFNIITRNGFGCYSCHLGPSGPMFGN